ncbi:MAG: hypothetical protein U0163_03885 [Gemmatimonadaceae bacterium]
MHFGAIVFGQAAGLQPHGPFVDRDRGGANDLLLLGLVGDAGRRLVDEPARRVAILRPDGPGDGKPGLAPSVTPMPCQGRWGALEPYRSRQPQPRYRDGEELVSAAASDDSTVNRTARTRRSGGPPFTVSAGARMAREPAPNRAWAMA